MRNLIVVDHPLVQDKLTRLRDRTTPVAEFRRLVREISMLLALEATRDLPLIQRPIETPLCAMQAPSLAGPPPALISILRAGNGMLDGMLDVIPEAAVGFVGLERDHTTHQPRQYYCKLPADLGARQTLVVDPMLATGGSCAAAVAMVRAQGAGRMRLVCLLAAPEGVDHMLSTHPDVDIVTAALDSHLDANAYIVPGLGDAGDRIFGTL
jgi:uracil phosphoribosyltransferase